MIRPNYKESNDDTNTIKEDDNNITRNQEDLSDRDRPLIKRKRYHRHTENQIRELESFFRECAHPDDKQRNELSMQLGLDPRQIKYWFQNKRTQNRNHQDHLENVQLRTENDKLRAENQQYLEAIANASCPKCGNQTAIGEMSLEELQFYNDNCRLQKEVNRMSALAEKYTCEMTMNNPIVMSPTPAPLPPGAFEIGMGSSRRGDDVHGNGRNFSRSPITQLTNAEKSKIIELTDKAMEELIKMAEGGEPLWMEGDNNGSRYALNFNEYRKTFEKGVWPRPSGFRIEASKETATIVMNPITIVEKLVDVNQWSTMFAGVVARVIDSEVLTMGVTGDFSGSLQLITAEIQVLSPLVSTRKVAFSRYCKKQANGIWAVADVSIDHIIPKQDITCWRRPSGCLVQEIQNGSKVTWVEHVEVDDRGGVHSLFRNLVSTGQALGANRWIAILGRQCERLNIIMRPTSFPYIENDVMTNKGRNGFLKLAERMARSFFGGLNTWTSDMWSILPGYAGDDVRLMTRKNSSGDPGRPLGVILCAATSFWVPTPPNTSFDLLQAENTRITWDVLFVGGTVEVISRIRNGIHRKNHVSLLRCADNNQNKVTMIQESSTDPTASFVFYAPLGQRELNSLMNGGDPDSVALLPSGFVIHPDGTGRGQGGSLLTAAFQILIDTDPSGTITSTSVATLEKHMLATVEKIKALFHSQIY